MGVHGSAKGHHSQGTKEGISAYNEYVRGQGTTLVKANSGVRETHQSAIDQNGGWYMHTAHSLTDSATIKSKALQDMLDELLAHPIISFLHVKLDDYKVVTSWSSLKVMFELLCNQYII